MAHGTPDWVRMVQIVVTVDNVPLVPEPATETAITRLDRLNTTSTSYRTVVSWTITAGKTGVLLSVEMESDDYEHTRFQLTIAGDQQFTDAQIESSLSLEWPEVHLEAGDEVLLEAKSSDGTAVSVDGDITGVEIG